jgi:hypothetical protein
LLIHHHCKELTISKGYLKEEIKLLQKLEQSLIAGRPIEASDEGFIKDLRPGTLVKNLYR